MPHSAKIINSHQPAALIIKPNRPAGRVVCPGHELFLQLPERLREPKSWQAKIWEKETHRSAGIDSLWRALLTRWINPAVSGFRIALKQNSVVVGEDT